MENQKALSVAQDAQPPAIPPRHHLNIEGLEDLTLEEDLILPRWRMIQYSSKIKGSAGEFNNNLTGEVRDHLDMIVLKVMPSRAFFNDNRQLVCLSRDGVTGSDGQLCATCPYSKWGPDRQPPACSRGYTFICLDPKDDTLCLLGALRTSVKPAKLYISQLAHLKKPPFTYITQFSTSEVDGPKGKYFVLSIALALPLNDKEREEAREQYQLLAGLSYQEVEEPISAEDFGDYEGA